jgi:peptidoglycan/xylan/chitin deacetylase (PgdA/CDA1 family)
MARRSEHRLPARAARATLRSLAHRCAASPPFGAAVRLADRVLPARAGLLTVLTYHRVDEPDRHPERATGLLSATPEGFDAQLDVVAGSCTVVSLDDVLAVREGRADLPPRAVLLTFDDAYDDFAEVAWPLLRHHGLPVTLFVPTAFPDAPDQAFWWDRLHDALARTCAPALDSPLGRLPLGTPAERAAAARALRSFVKSRPHEEAMGHVEALLEDLEVRDRPSPVLGWDRLRALAADGVALAPHSRTHPLLTRVGPDRLAEEVVGSRSDLERELGSAPPAFAYPSGANDDAVIAAVAAAGYRVAFTTARGNESVQAGAAPDWLRLRRVNVGGRTTPGLLLAQLLPVPLPPRRRNPARVARTS